jgi:hypothetical protein
MLLLLVKEIKKNKSKRLFDSKQSAIQVDCGKLTVNTYIGYSTTVPHIRMMGSIRKKHYRSRRAVKNKTKILFHILLLQLLLFNIRWGYMAIPTVRQTFQGTKVTVHHIKQLQAHNTFVTYVLHCIYQLGFESLLKGHCLPA